ncbi:beta-N-acetylglucosaminidase domain-containing protein [Kitasatospora sp. NPDC002227]|uniref:beta-N-acetylglucosaminidase domain-containing protein n=1 Tax=Kitasatospora sp. NPDC002227 TaxID=3154773 RepID=UPI003327FB76
MQARVSVVAGRRLRDAVERSAALREVLGHPAALAARRVTARTARQWAPKTADRLIADLKGTEPLLESVRAERRRGPRRRALQLAATLSAAAVVGGLVVSAPGYATAAVGQAVSSSTTPGQQTPTGSLTKPQIYPKPQEMQTGGAPVTVPKSVALVLADKADAPAVAALKDVLREAGATEITEQSTQSQTPVTGALVVYVGGPAEGADGTADRALRDLSVAAGDKDTQGPSFTGLPSGGYLLATGQLPTLEGTFGAIVLAGVDQAGTFNAVQSLRQLLAPTDTGTAIPAVTVRDWPSGAPLRGLAESFYGEPWSTRQRLEQVDFLGRTKQNFYLYAPGGDPYRLSRWRDAYPDGQAAQLRQVGDRARANHVTLGYSIDPGQSLCYSSAKDADALVAKLEQLRQLGFGAFQLQFTDVSYTEWHCSVDRKNFGTGPAAAAKAQAALVAKVRDRFQARHPELAPLSVVPTEYQRSGDSPYRKALTAALPKDVQIAWSGGAVFPAKITTGQVADTAAALGHPLMTLDSYPANDSAPDRLFLGAYGGRDTEVASRSAALVTAAMSQPVASRVPLATAADFAWNPAGYRPADSWRAALRTQTTSDAALAALTALAGNSQSSPLAATESGYLTPLLDHFWAALDASGNATPDLAGLTKAAAPVRDAFTTMAGAQQALGQQEIGAETAPWLARLSAYGRAGQTAVDMLLAQHGGDGAKAWQARVALRQLRAQLAQGTATVGAGVLDAFLDRALREADSWSGVKTGAVAPTTTLGTAHDHAAALMTDDAPDTFYWSSAPPQTGDAVGLDLGPGRPLGSVTVLMGSWGNGPDAASAADDYLHDGVLEYTTGEGGWKQLAKVHNQKNVTATAPPGTVAKAVRLRATASQKTGMAVRDFSITAPGDTVATVSGGPAPLPGSGPASVLDGNPDTAYRAAAAPAATDTPLTIELGAARPMDRVTVLTDPSVRATATLEVRRAGAWAAVGTVQPGYNELPAPGAVDAMRLLWAPGGEPPVVNQVVPWYADTPAARLSLSDPALDVVAGQATPVQTKAVLESGRPEGATGELKAEVPAAAKGLTVTPTAAVTVPRGSQVGAPVQLTAAPDTPSGTYQVPLSFTVGSVTVRQTLQVHVVPPTGGADLAPGSTASSSGDETADFPASAVADGDQKTRWSSPAKDDAWVQLKLAQPVRLGSLVLHWQDAYASAYQVQTSADGTHWTTVAKVDDGRGGTETVHFDAPGTQYVRVQGVSRATKYGYSLWGVEAYAVAVPQPPAPPALPLPSLPLPSLPPLLPGTQPTPGTAAG